MNLFREAVVLFVSAVAPFDTTMASDLVSSAAYEEIAHHAVSVRFRSSCDESASMLETTLSEGAYLIISAADSAYLEYRKSGKSLIHLATGKVKCKQTEQRFSLESQRAMRAIDLALSRGESVNEYNALGITPLHSAALSGNENIVRHLLSRGASRETRTLGSFLVDEGQTPLDLALTIHEMNPALGHSEVIQVLRGEGP